MVWHSTLTVEQSQSLENVQKLCVKIILGEKYNGYEDALRRCKLESLADRREDKCLKFGLKCLLHPIHSEKFPVNPHVLTDSLETRSSEHFKVNWARTDSYRMSAIPYIQRLLNKYVNDRNTS